MEPKILGTGANGFTGHYFVRYLAERNIPVRAMYYGPDGRPNDLVHDCVDLVPGDVRDRKQIRAALEGIDVVQHVAALYRPTNISQQQYYDVNVDGTVNMVELAKEAGVRRFVQCSTIGVHGTAGREPVDEDAPIRPDDYYQESKWLGEKAAVEKAAELELPLTVIRPAGIYGPRERRFLKIAQLVHRRRFLMFGDGTTLYHFIHVRDLCDAFMLAAESEAAVGNRYIIADDHAISIDTFVGLLARSSGVKPPRLHIPFALLQCAAVLCEGVCKPLGLSPPIHRRRAAWFKSNRCFDISRARKDLGYEPSVSIEAGVADMVRSYFEAGWLPENGRSRPALETLPLVPDDACAAAD